jgi:hypothetical protein
MQAITLKSSKCVNYMQKTVLYRDIPQEKKQSINFHYVKPSDIVLLDYSHIAAF